MFDRGDEVGDGREVAAAQRLAGDDREERLDQVQPRPRGRREVQPHPGMTLQPRAHRSVLVGGQGVDHDVQPGPIASSIARARRTFATSSTVPPPAGGSGGDPMVAHDPGSVTRCDRMTRPSAWTSVQTRSTEISFQTVDGRLRPTANAELSRGFRAQSRSLNHAGNISLQRVIWPVPRVSGVRLVAGPRDLSVPARVHRTALEAEDAFSSRV